MGCDYYTWVETVIVYKDLSGATHRFVERGPQEKHYDDLSDVDTDFRALPQTSQLVAEAIRAYGNKKMFTDTYWLCHYNGKLRIKDLCTANDIPFDSLVSVHKQLGGRER